MPRYAVLHDLSDSATRPVGLLTESANRVRLFAMPGFRGQTSFDGEYVTIEPDGSIVTYRPGMDEYWDYVLLMLSRTFLVGEVDSLDVITKADVLQLFYSKVVGPRDEEPKLYIMISHAAEAFQGFSLKHSFSVSSENGPGEGRRQSAYREDEDRLRKGSEKRRSKERHRSGGVPIAA